MGINPKDLPLHLQKQLGLEKPKKDGRYKVVDKSKRTADGILFDSMWEKDGYLLLKGLIGLDRFTMQEYIVLQDSFVFRGKKYRPIRYKADFIVDDELVIDTKGHRTETFNMKLKMAAKMGVFIHCWKDSRNAFGNLENLKDILRSGGVEFKENNNAHRKNKEDN